ncbi:hypothetical protein VP01_7414g1, partial [Puccinia sorghi]
IANWGMYKETWKTIKEDGMDDFAFALVLKKFMRLLNTCHSALLRHMRNTKFQIKFELQPFLINWIDQVLFDVNQKKLPLLGDFILEDGRLLIHLIISHNSHRRKIQGAICVFGYWLKKVAIKLYSQLFKNDEEYWDILTQIIDC